MTISLQGDVRDSKGKTGFAIGEIFVYKFNKDTYFKLFQLNAFKDGNLPFYKLGTALFSKTLDFEWLIIKQSDDRIEHRNYITYHDNLIHFSVGKAKKDSMEMVFVTKETLGLFAYSNYDWQKKEFVLNMTNSFTNPDFDNIYCMSIGRLATTLLTLDTVPVNFPIFTSYLNFGELTHNFNMKINEETFELLNEFGFAFTKNFMLGAGVFFEKKIDEDLKVTPVISFAFNIPLTDAEMIHLEGTWKDGNSKVYAYFMMSL
ncbi:MAG: hypothetical protein PHG05_02650 [Candidatus Nanoarchaeia archaeon]|nr:hypothetical protein [Candidatus Nanoarchaeia archaeon]